MENTGRRTARPLAEIEGFVELMGRDWADDPTPATVAEGLAASVADHRRRLSEQLPGRAIVVFAGAAVVRNWDQLFAFRPDSDFLWLTGCAAEHAALVMVPTGSGHDSVLFIPEPVRPGTPGFIGDHDHSRLWVPPLPELAAWEESLGVTVRPLSTLGDFIDGSVGAASGELLVGGRPTTLAPVLGGVSGDLAKTIASLRMIKDDWEIRELRRAVAATIAAFGAVVSEVPNAIRAGGERWLQGTFERHARTWGNGPGYGVILATGNHANVLHWVQSDGPVVPGELLLIDAGVETSSFYTADVARTFPIDGSFTEPQRRVYELVHASHVAALAAVGPGKDYADFDRAAMEVLVRGLHDWGVLSVSVDEALSPEGQHHRRYLVCGVGHHLGIDVHDAGAARHENAHGSVLRPGMVTTVEPGLYFHANDLTLPPELRGIGIRSEDNVVVTETGIEILSASMPSELGALEAWTRERLGRPVTAPSVSVGGDLLA